MKMKNKNTLLRLALCVLFCVLAASAPCATVFADLDRIDKYEITVDVNDDATLTMTYRIVWTVLDSDSEGPLSWVVIGLPNDHVADLAPLSATVDSVVLLTEGGCRARVDLDREYYAGETVAFEFSLVQDYMYQVDRFTEGETVYSLTPGWFDDIDVKELTVRWNGGGVLSKTPECTVDPDGFLVWTRALDKGDKFTISVTYPNDAFAFDLGKTIESGGQIAVKYDGAYDNDDRDALLGGLIFIAIVVIVLVTKKKISDAAYGSTANFSGGKKITRTRIVYYPTCQGCGAARSEGEENCSYCGRSLVKDKEVITEDQIPDSEKELKKVKADGTYTYSGDPHTALRVHVVNVPVRSPSSSSRSSCASSSCACACASSCACACACACAGGGRAGCSAKDFYSTGLKLAQLEAKNKR